MPRKTRQELVDEFREWLDTCLALEESPEELVAEAADVVLITDEDLIGDLRDEGRIPE